MLLCVRVQDIGVHVRQTAGESLLNRTEDRVGSGLIDVQQDDELIGWIMKRLKPCCLDQALSHACAERSVPGRDTNFDRDVSIPEMRDKMGECASLRLAGGYDDDVLRHFAPKPFVS